VSGRRAKAIRREVYGELSRREPRRLLATDRNPSTAFNDPKTLRAIYQAAKRETR